MVAVLHEIGAPSHSNCIESHMIRAERAAELADQVSSKRRLQVWMFKLQASSFKLELRDGLAVTSTTGWNRLAICQLSWIYRRPSQGGGAGLTAGSTTWRPADTSL
jgi:hypothetical protein